MPGVVAIDARHQQVVVVGVDVADRCGDGEADGVGIERSAGGASSDATAAAQCGVVGDRVGAGRWAAGELFPDGSGEAVAELLIDFGTAHLIVVAAQGAGIGVVEALLGGLLDGIILDQNALAFIAFASRAPADDHRRQAAGFLRASSQGGIAGGQEDQMAEVGAVQTADAGIGLDEEFAGVVAGVAGPGVVGRYHGELASTRGRIFRRRTLGRSPAGSEGAFDRSVATAAELEIGVVDFPRHEALALSPASQGVEGGGDLGVVDRHAAVQGGEPAALPAIDVDLCEPAQPDQDVGGLDELLLGQGGLGDACDTGFDICHDNLRVIPLNDSGSSWSQVLRRATDSPSTIIRASPRAGSGDSGGRTLRSAHRGCPQ